MYFDVCVLRRVVEYFQVRRGYHLRRPRVRRRGLDDRGDRCTPPFNTAKLPYRILIGQPATFFRSEVVADEKLRVNLQFSMDYEYWLRLAQNCSFRHVDDVLARFRAYETQKSQDREAMAEDRREVFNNYEYPAGGLSRRCWTTGASSCRGWLGLRCHL